AIAAPWFAALVVAVYPRHVRIIAFVAALTSVVACAAPLGVVAPGQSLFQALMLLFSCLTLGAALMIPRRDCNAETMSGMLVILGSTLLAYSADNLLVLFAAWVLSTVPFFVPRWLQAASWRPRTAILLSALSLGLAVALIGVRTHTLWIASLKGQSPGGMAVFVLLIGAVIFRKGILPAHAWVADAAEGG